MHNFHYVYHKETDEPGYRLQEGEFEGVVWNYRDVKLPIHDEDGNRLNLEEVEAIPLTFAYDVLYNKDGLVNEESVERFNNILGDILLTVIEEGLESDQIIINPETGNDDTEQSDL
jgi:hypothetical protein|tara:strand:+ start:1409 stop:1756 length:348 start_codon:yes stop_codon:yes gene_type:complete